MISSEIEAEVHRLFYVEHMKVNTISQHLQIHRDAVQRALRTERFRNHRYRESILDPFEVGCPKTAA